MNTASAATGATWRRDMMTRAGLATWLIGCGAILAVAALSRRPSWAAAAIDAVPAFWAGRPVYDAGIWGVLYLPPSFVLASPFGLIPGGALAWRVTSVALLTIAAFRLGGLIAPGQALRAAAIILALMFPTASGVIHNGQFEGPMLALLGLSAADIAQRRWWRAAFLAAIAVALKPVGMVFFLLAAACWPAFGWRAVLLLAAALLLPFLNPDWSYVVEIYGVAVAKIVAATAPGIGPFNDLHMLLTTLGVRPPEGVMTGLRIVAAALTLWLARVAIARHDQVDAALAVFALAQTYQLLFNPRTEGLSYIGLGLLGGLFAARALLVEQRKTLAAALATDAGRSAGHDVRRHGRHRAHGLDHGGDARLVPRDVVRRLRPHVPHTAGALAAAVGAGSGQRPRLSYAVLLHPPSAPCVQ